MSGLGKRKTSFFFPLNSNHVCISTTTTLLLLLSYVGLSELSSNFSKTSSFYLNFLFKYNQSVFGCFCAGLFKTLMSCLCSGMKVAVCGGFLGVNM